MPDPGRRSRRSSGRHPRVDDAALPPSFDPPRAIDRELRQVAFCAARWTPAALAQLADRVSRGGAALVERTDAELLDAWERALGEFLPGQGSRWRELAPSLARLTGLSEPGLDAALRVVLGGATGRSARDLFTAARAARTAGVQRVATSEGAVARRPVVIFLSSNLPGLAVQPLLTALALRRPVVVKSASAEPLFTPALLRALAERCPAIGEAWAALTWTGGDEALERPLLEVADRILAYGGQSALDSLRARAPRRVVGFGPKLSLGYATAAADVEAAGRGFARDIALFDQRGCLSIQAIYTEGDPGELATAVAAALDRIADDLPPGPLDPALLARVQNERLTADLRGLTRPELAVGRGTVIVDPEPTLRPTPGLRTVRVHPIASASALADHLQGWQGQIQGVAIAGAAPTALTSGLAALDVSRIAPAGELQDVDAAWRNGGRDPLAILTEPPPDRD